MTRRRAQAARPPDSVPTPFPVLPGTMSDPIPFPKGNGAAGMKSDLEHSRTPGMESRAEVVTRGTSQSRAGSATELHRGSDTVNVRGASGDKRRGAYCTPRYVADALPHFFVDPFSNERSHIRSHHACWRERGDDGYGLPPTRKPGHFFSKGWQYVATSEKSVWLQPDYTDTLNAWRHYAHTRWVALLRFDPRTEWFELVYSASEWVGVLPNSPGKSSFEFDKPPGAEHGAGNTFPHAIYARYAEDVTPEMLELCSLPTGSSLSWRKKSRT